jgi:hypothetical protein
LPNNELVSDPEQPLFMQSASRLDHIFPTLTAAQLERIAVRAGNVKWVASAVGEGSIAVSFVHRVLAE